MTTFPTADWHLFHGSIIRYCDRPYKDVNQMHQQLIYEHNLVVEPNDEVWVIGDVTLDSVEYAFKIKKVVDKFHGRKHLILGNHDDWKPASYEKMGFITVHTAMWFEHCGYTFYLMHDPATYAVIERNPKAVLLCGHVHNLFKHLLPKKRVINVGVDAWKNPLSLDQIVGILTDYSV